MKDNRDALDYGEMRVSKLFYKLFFPTLLGLLSSVLLNLADGIFVGQGVGSDTLAAINIAAPMFLVSTGIALMFGSGASIVAAVHLSKGNRKAANINVTQAFTVGLLLMLTIVVIVNVFPRQTAALFGGSEALYPLVHDYLFWVSPCFCFMIINIVGTFAIRLDGSPNFSMTINTLSALVNIVLDWLFIFPFDMGIKGAAIATSISGIPGMVLVAWYFWGHSNQLRLYRPKFSQTALHLTARNCGYMLRLGFPTFIAETAICCMIITGNYMFIGRLHEDGVAAFSVACYLFPMIFMFGNAIAQTALPIVSYNYGKGNQDRIRQTLHISAGLSVGLGLVMTTVGILLAPQIVNLFIDGTSPANAIGHAGLPLFLTSSLPFTVNVVLIGYLQSLERYKAATFFMLLRGFVLIIPSFILLPELLGNTGLWLAETVAETLTLVVLIGYLLWKRKQRGISKRQRSHKQRPNPSFDGVKFIIAYRQ